MIEELLKYQETDAKLRKIEVELGSSDERAKAYSARAFLESVDETVDKLEARATELNAAYNAAISELEKMKGQESEFNTAKDAITDENAAEYLIKKTDEILGRIKNLSAEVGRISNEIQNVVNDYNTVRAKAKAAKAQYEEYGAKYNELRKSKSDEMNAIKQELEVLKKDVKPDLMARYQKKRSDKIFPIVFELSNNVCGACNMELPMSEISKLNKGEIIECEHCRRLLYVKQS